MGIIIKDRKDGNLTIENEMGATFTLSEQEAWDLRTLLDLEVLKEDIHEFVTDYDGEWIALGSFDGTQEDFEREVYDRLEGGVQYGEYPSETYIEETIFDTARSYGIKID